MTSLALMTQGNFAGFERQFLLQLHLKNLKFQIVLSLFRGNQIHITCCLLCAKLYANEPDNDLSKLTPFHVLKSNFRKRTCTLKHLFPHPNCLMMVFCFSHKISINQFQFTHNCLQIAWLMRIFKKLSEKNETLLSIIYRKGLAATKNPRVSSSCQVTHLS